MKLNAGQQKDTRLPKQIIILFKRINETDEILF